MSIQKSSHVSLSCTNSIFQWLLAKEPLLMKKVFILYFIRPECMQTSLVLSTAHKSDRHIPLKFSMFCLMIVLTHSLMTCTNRKTCAIFTKTFSWPMSDIIDEQIEADQHVNRFWKYLSGNARDNTPHGIPITCYHWMRHLHMSVECIPPIADPAITAPQLKGFSGSSSLYWSQLLIPFTTSLINTGRGKVSYH